MHPEDVQKLIGLLDDQSVRDKLCSVLGIAPPFTLESVFREAEPAVGANALRLPSVHRPDRASRLSRALAEMHEAHRRVKKANRTQAQTISKLQAELAAANSNRDGAIQNASDYFNRIIRPGDVIAISMCGASSYHRYRVYGINGLTLKLEALPDDA